MTRATGESPAARLASLTADRAWRHLAACKGKTELFFPDDNKNGGRNSGALMQQYALAKRICSECPVQSQCFSYALTNNIQVGIWGGVSMSPMARRRRKKNPPTVIDLNPSA